MALRHNVALAMLAALGSACATSGAGESAQSPATDDWTPARVTSCPAAPRAQLTNGQSNITRVMLSFTIDERGAVVPSSVHPVPQLNAGRSTTTAAPAVESAREQLALCEFTPATRDGLPVSSSMRREFRVVM